MSEKVNFMMKIDKDLAQKIRISAIKADKNYSQFISDVLTEYFNKK